MKKLLLALATTTLIAGPAMASCCEGQDLAVKLHGSFDFQGAVRQQNKLHDDSKFLTSTQKNGAFYTKANVRATVSNTTDNDLTYGAMVVLQTTAKSRTTGSVNGSHLFLESEFGKVELGSREGAGSMMATSAYSIARATGDDWFNYVNLNPDKLYNGTPLDSTADFSGNFAAQDGAASSTEQARKITYYTPKFNGLQAGISFTPDSTNAGDGSLDSASGAEEIELFDRKYNSGFKNKRAVKNVVGAGISYEHNLSDGVDLTIALTGEMGKAQKVAMPVDDQVKLKDLKSYNVGAVLNMGNFAFGGSYTDLGKSLTAERYDYDVKRARSYTAGVAYTQGPVGISLTYLKTEKNKNKLDAYTVGTDYKMAPGLMPYAEVTVFNAKNHGYKVADNTDPELVRQKRKGAVYMLGAKLEF